MSFIGSLDVAVWVQTVPGVLVLAVSAVLVVLSGTVVAGLYCLLSVRRRNTSTSHRYSASKCTDLSVILEAKC